MTATETANKLTKLLLEPIHFDNIASWVSSFSGTETERLIDQAHNEPNQAIRYYKFEVLCMYLNTHNKRYVGIIISNRLFSNKDVTPSDEVCTNSNTSNPKYHRPINQFVPSTSLHDKYILSHLTLNRKLIPKYLHKHLFISKPRQQATFKTINNNQFDLVLLQNWLNQHSTGITSKHALELLESVPKGTCTNGIYSAILAATPKPSIALQKFLDGSAWSNATCNTVVCEPNVATDDTKYLTMDNASFRDKLHHLCIPSVPQSFDERDSDIKPFITGMPRTPETSSYNVTNLLSRVTSLSHFAVAEPQYAVNYNKLRNELITYLQDDLYSDQRNKYKAMLKVHKQAIEQTLKDL